MNFLWLPLSHGFGKVMLALPLQIGFPTAIDGRVDKIVDNLAALHPTFMGAVPRIFEKARYLDCRCPTDAITARCAT